MDICNVLMMVAKTTSLYGHMQCTNDGIGQHPYMGMRNVLMMVAKTTSLMDICNVLMIVARTTSLYGHVQCTNDGTYNQDNISDAINVPIILLGGGLPLQGHLPLPLAPNCTSVPLYSDTVLNMLYNSTCFK